MPASSAGGAAPGPPRARWASPAAILALCAALALVAHAGALGGGYVYDDVPIVVENPLTTSLDHAGEWFTSPYWPGHALYYRPLVVAGYALERALFGLAPAIAHAINLAWHLAVVLLVTSLAMRLAREAGARDGDAAITGLVAGALFAVHPLLTEPIYWISARSDLLGAAATLGALRLARAARPGAIARGTGVGLVTLAGLLCKETVAVVPLLLLLDGAWRRRHTRTDAPRVPITPALTGALVATIAYAALRALAFGSSLGLGDTAGADAESVLHNPLVAEGGIERALTPLAILALVGARLVWPHRLSSDYALESIPLAHDLGDIRILVGALLAVAAIALTVRSLRRDGLVAWGLAFALVTWLPASNTIVLGGALFGERFVYLPAAGLALALGAAARGPWRRAGRSRRRVLVGLVACIVAAAGVRDHVRARDWVSSEALYTSVVRSYPQNAQGHYNLGVLRLEAAGSRPPGDPGREHLLVEAEAHFRRATEIHPGYLLAQLNAGVSLAERGLWPRALAAYERAAAIDPDDPRVQYNLGVAAEALGDRERAVAHYRRSAAGVPGGGPAALALRRLGAMSR